MDSLFLKNNKFPIFFTAAMLALSAASLWLDIAHRNEVFWFQRSGALLVLAGANLQYAKIVDLWRSALDVQARIPTAEEKIANGQGIGMRAAAEESSETRDLAIRIHNMVTEKSGKDIVAVIFIVAGTVIWGYGDLPFKC